MPAEQSPRSIGTTPTFPIHINRSSPLLIAGGLAMQPVRIIGYRQRPSGNGLHAVAPRAGCFPGVMSRQSPVPATTLVGRTDLNRLDNRNPMSTAFLRCARTYMSGAAIGSKRITTGAHRIEIRRGRKQAVEEHRGEVRGDTRSRSRDARLGPAFRQSSGTRTMAFAWCETRKASFDSQRGETQVSKRDLGHPPIPGGGHACFYGGPPPPPPPAEAPPPPPPPPLEPPPPPCEPPPPPPPPP